MADPTYRCRLLRCIPPSEPKTRAPSSIFFMPTRTGEPEKPHPAARSIAGVQITTNWPPSQISRDYRSNQSSKALITDRSISPHSAVNHHDEGYLSPPSDGFEQYYASYELRRDSAFSATHSYSGSPVSQTAIEIERNLGSPRPTLEQKRSDWAALRQRLDKLFEKTEEGWRYPRSLSERGPDDHSTSANLNRGK